MSTQGSTTVNFSTGALEARVVITGQSGYNSSTNLVEAWPLSNEAIGSFQDDSCWVEGMQAFVINRVNGVGFTLLMKPNYGNAFGSYNVGWVFN